MNTAAVLFSKMSSLYYHLAYISRNDCAERSENTTVHRSGGEGWDDDFRIFTHEWNILSVP